MPSASLRPVAGAPYEVLQLLRQWLAVAGPVDSVVVRTSGSSGRPKDVVLSRAALLASAKATHARLGGHGRWLLDLPAQHVGGLQVLLRSAVAGTEPVVAAEHASLPDALEELTQDSAGPTYASLVPTQLFRLARTDQLAALARCTAVLVGGSALDPGLASAARDAGVRVVRTYGMSETGGGCVYDGLPLDGVAVRIDDHRQVHLAGPTLFEGYDGDPARTAAVLQAGWFATGDLGEIGVDGRLRVVGRADDVVVSGGVNVSLPAVTSALAGTAGVAEAYAVGVPDEEWGTRVVACVVAAGRHLDLSTLRGAVEAAGLPRTWAPRQLVTLERLPLLENGKVDRLLLRDIAER